ncbi:DUF1217 domain-containing protein [Acetobacter sp. AN02]|uniref:DUF1217 domain-containing protein n=1 Tax=Acetobacter sp. AN02 TaxID=2894186 RepID=UPI0024343826|nr:DUF1217 domain-containing protein [Acetobacter sp. AN02]MDG6094644.1 DUF1217 domain-containing protein [Acetobacter sp. AN02]
MRFACSIHPSVLKHSRTKVHNTLYEKDEDKYSDTYAKTDAQTLGEVGQFRKIAPEIKTADDLLNNYKALTVVLGAYNLGSLQNSRALVKALMTQDPTSDTSVAAKSKNPTWIAFAKDFSAWQGTSSSTSAADQPFGTADKISAIITKFQKNQFEDSLNEDDSGVGNALYFTRTMTDSMNLTNIMGDTKLLKVVETVSGFDPTTFGALSYDQQVRMLSKVVKTSDFSTPEKIKQYAERYLAMLQINPQPSSKPATMLSLYGADGSSNSILSLFGDSSGSSSLVSALF